jgi:hypothetical protein
MILTILSTFIIFIVPFLEQKYFNNINRQFNDIENLKMSISMFLSSIILLLCGIFFLELKYDFLNDYKFWAFAVVEFLGIFLLKFNFSKNKDNMSNVSFAMFSIIYTVPFINYLYSGILDFNNDINIEYTSNIEFIIILSSLFILNILFFFDKIRTLPLENFFYLLLMVLVLTNSVYFGTKLVQEYNGFLIFSLVYMFLLGPLFLVKGFIKKEYINLKKYSYINIIKSSLLLPISTLLFILFSKVIALEIVVVSKRLGIIISGLIIDKSNNKKVKKKDIILTIIIFIILIYYLYISLI